MSVEHASDSKDRLRWFKSSYSGSGGGNCLQVATDLDAVYVRDSKTVGNGPVLRLGRGAWAAFVDHAAK
jgi:hypothetical protein